MLPYLCGRCMNISSHVPHRQSLSYSTLTTTIPSADTLSRIASKALSLRQKACVFIMYGFYHHPTLMHLFGIRHPKYYPRFLGAQSRIRTASARVCREWAPALDHIFQDFGAAVTRQLSRPWQRLCNCTLHFGMPSGRLVRDTESKA
jgi:hypothetical protein